MLSIISKRALFVVGALLFFALPVGASHDTNTTDNICPTTWRPQYSVECSTGRVACGTVSGVPQCRSTLPTATVQGQTLNCDNCRFECPQSAPIVCSGACSARRSCSAQQNRVTADECTGSCGDCREGFLVNPSDLNGACIPEPSRAYINYDNPGDLRTLNALRIVGNDADISDLYLNSGRAIQIDGAGATSLELRTSGSGNFGVIIRGPSAEAVSELRLAQGDSDRWAVSVRPTSSDFSLWRRSTAGWDALPRLRINYQSGEVRLEDNLSVGGSAAFGRPLTATGATFTGAVDAASIVAASATVGGRAVLTEVAPLDGGGIAVTGTGSSRAIGLISQGCAGGQVLRRNTGNTGWECGTISGGTVGAAEEDDPRFTAWRGTPDPGAQTLANLTVNSVLTLGSGAPEFPRATSGVRVGGDVTASGCFGPTAVGATTATYDGNLVNADGYREVDALCRAAFAGSHQCTTDEVMSSIHCGAVWSDANRTTLQAGIPQEQFVWISNGAPSLPTPTNDCYGWTQTGVIGDEQSQGVTWYFDGSGGAGYARACNESYRVLCCR